MAETFPIQPIAVLGAGSYGTALALCMARNGTPTVLWGRDKAKLTSIQAARENTFYLPGAKFPDSLKIETDLATTITQHRDILVVVPSHAFAETLKLIKPHLLPDARIAWASKGLDPESGDLLQDTAIKILGEHTPLAVVSGPTFAKEMAVGLPTVISVSSHDDDFSQAISDRLHCEKSFRVYKNTDFIGIQLGGAVKNVIAIGAGMADGIGFGANARAALITRGLAEMGRLGKALGATSESIMGMACLGDLVLTCTDDQSRNRRFGLALGKGESVDAAIAAIGQVVEGYRNAKEVHTLAKRHNVEMPITEQIYAVLYQGKTAKEAALNLLGREQRVEGE